MTTKDKKNSSAVLRRRDFLAGTAAASIAVTGILKSNVSFAQSSKTGTVRVWGEPGPYGGVAVAAMNEWAQKNAPGLKSLEDALEIRRRVLLAFERAERVSDSRERKKLLTFAVIGGGPTGVEMCGAIAELSRYVLSQDFRSADRPIPA